MQGRRLVEMAVRRKVGPNSEKGGEKENEQDGAAEPGHLRGDETKSFLAARGCQPIVLVREIDPGVRASGNEARHKERDAKR